jgi:hypothetical protein
LANRFVISYKFNRVKDYYLSRSETNDTASQGALLRTYDSLDANRFIYSAGVASIIAAHRAEYRAKPLLIIEFDVTPEAVNTVDPTDIIAVTHFAGINATAGGWDAEPFYVEGITYDCNNFRAHIQAIRYTSFLEDAYILQDDAEVTVSTGAAGNTITTDGTTTVTKAAGSNFDVLGVSANDVLEMWTPTNTLFRQITVVGTTTITVDSAIPAEVGVTDWEITNTWDTETTYDHQFGSLAQQATRTTAGTVTTATTSNVLTGAATAFVADAVAAGDEIHVIHATGGFWALVKSVTDATHLVMDRYAPYAVAGASYIIYRSASNVSYTGTVPGRNL